MKLDALNFGIAGGIIWGVTVFICTLLAIYTGYSETFLAILQSVYPGYHISLLGSFVGLIYGFLDGFLGFFLLAWLYNKIKRTS